MKIFNQEAFRTPPKCLLLDFDNTLYDYDCCNAAGMEAARWLAKSLVTLDPSEFDRCFEEARLAVKQDLGPTASSHSRFLYFQRTFELAGFASSARHTQSLDRMFWSNYLDKAVLFHEVLDFLDDVRMAGISVAVVTDQMSEIQMRKLEHLRLDTYIDWVVTSEEVGADKPDPRMFQRALEKLGHTDGPVWMIGDSLQSDIDGARRAIGAIGLQKVHGTVRPATSVAEADAVFHNFKDLRKLFANTLANDDGLCRAGTCGSTRAGE